MPAIESTAQNRLYMGIDPGGMGGIAVINGDRSFKYTVSLKGMNCTDLWATVCQVHRLWNDNSSLTTIMEQVGGYIGKGEGQKGGGAANGSAMFAFGTVYGRLQMAMKAKGIYWKEVEPQRWQKEFISKEEKIGITKSELKRLLKEKAKAIFPTLKVTLQICDALLLSEYARRIGESSYANRLQEST